jgi:hypothetical protein
MGFVLQLASFSLGFVLQLAKFSLVSCYNWPWVWCCNWVYSPWFRTSTDFIFFGFVLQLIFSPWASCYNWPCTGMPSAGHGVWSNEDIATLGLVPDGLALLEILKGQDEYATGTYQHVQHWVHQSTIRHFGENHAD